MPPGRAALSPPRYVIHGILARGRLELVPVNRLKSVPPRVVRRDPLILDLELRSHPLRYSAARRIAASAIPIRLQHGEKRPVATLTASLSNVIEKPIGDQAPRRTEFPGAELMPRSVPTADPCRSRESPSRHCFPRKRTALPRCRLRQSQARSDRSPRAAANPHCPKGPPVT